MNEPVLVTSVPVVHLRAVHRGRGCFGTRSVDVVERFDELATGDRNVWIHGSRDDGRDPDAPIETVEWVATWSGWEHGQTSGPSSRQFRRARPSTAVGETNWWFAYYLIDGLVELDEPVPTRQFSSWKSSEEYRRTFVPRGPTIAIGP